MTRRDQATAQAGHRGSGPLRVPTISVVVPALNEEPCIDWVLQGLPGWVSEVVLVDGLSSDGTELVARRVIPDVLVVHQATPGKGAALRAGFEAASGDIIVMLDADGSTNPAEIGRFVRALEEGATFVKGSRHMPGGGSADLTLLRGVGNRALVALTNLLYGCRFTDLCYGYCAFWRRDLPALEPTSDGFEIETQLILSAVRAGLQIREVPSIELARRAGLSNLNAFRDGLRVLQTILNERPGREAARRRGRRRMRLVPVEVPAPGTPGWVPPGRDRRSRDRRKLGTARSLYRGGERRRQSRRRSPVRTVTIYRADEASLQPSLGPIIRRRSWPRRR